MNATFKVSKISQNHGGTVEVTLKQTYSNTTKELNDSTDPTGQVTLEVTDKSGFFQLGDKYMVSFTSLIARPVASAIVDEDARDAWLAKNPGKTPAEYAAYERSLTLAVPQPEPTKPAPKADAAKAPATGWNK
jgi:hypothetical protein